MSTHEHLTCVYTYELIFIYVFKNLMKLKAYSRIQFEFKQSHIYIDETDYHLLLKLVIDLNKFNNGF